jgi:O-antigen/teichoic acid export membrane protein
LIIAGAQACIVATSALSALITAKQLGVSGRGQYATVATLIAISATIAMTGSPTFVVRSKRHATDARITGIVSLNSILSAIIVGAAGGTLYLMATWPTRTAAAALVAILLVTPATVAQVYAEQFAAELQAQHLFQQLALRRLVWTVTPSLTAAALAWLTSNWMASAGALCLTPGLALLLILIRDRRHKLPAPPRPKSPRTINHWLAALKMPTYQTALASWLLLLILLLLYRLDVLILALLGGSTDVGIYSMSAIAAEIAWLYVNAKSVTLLPALVHASEGDRRKLIGASIVRCSAVTSAFAFLAIILGRPVVHMLLGPTFSRSYTCLLLLMPGILAFVPVKLWITYTAAVGRNRNALYVITGALLCNVTLNLILIPHNGAEGAAISCSAAYAGCAATLLIFAAVQTLSARRKKDN